MSNVFEIRDLRCSYNRNEEVLIVDELDIPKGNLTVLLGISGSGKSTLLETLGLMNNTLMPKSKVNYISQLESYEYQKIWDKKEQYVASVRNNYFSFIFQDTNLMPGFTAYENVAVTQLLQGKSLKDATKKVKHYMRIMGLEEVGLDKKAYELAGGQKQRLAFVRAITPEFDVLFADEPTGNLDRRNASEVMAQLKKQVKTLNKSAIIVTHDINLAMEFADLIVVIDKKNGIGRIKNGNVLQRQKDGNWTNRESVTVNLNHKLKELLDYDE